MSQHSWDHSRSAAAARILVELGGDHGVAPAAILVGTGLVPGDLDIPTLEIEAGLELAIARNLLARVGDRPGLGVEAGCRYTVGNFGVWGFALLTSPTARDLVRLGTRYAALSFAFIRPVFEEDADNGWVVFDDADVPADVCDFFVERELAKIVTLAPVVFGDKSGYWVETRFAGPRGAALRVLPGNPDVRTGQPRHLLGFKRALLDQTLPQADPVTAGLLETQCADLLERRRRRRGVAAQVRARLLTDLHDPPSLDDIATDLHVDARTLRRKLTAEGTSYRELADEVHSTLAIELLGPGGLTVEEVARRLGYHDAAGFSRAFKRWTGRTPGSYRCPVGQTALL